MPSNQQIVSNLNLTGNFLEASTFSRLVESDHFLVTAEWPFSQPTFQGTADIIALNHNVNWDSEPLVFFAIECKKAKPDQKVWVFDSNRTDRDLRHPMLKITQTGQTLYEGRAGYLIPNLGVNRVEDAPLFNKGYELRENDGNLNRNESERIYVSLTQANKAAVGLAKTNYKEIFDVNQQVFARNPIAIVPVVITNAKLKTISYDPSSIDSNSGEIRTADVTFQDRDWLMFDYPLTNDLQLPGDFQNRDGTVQPIKRPTYIISASNFVSILQEIATAAEY